MTLICFIFGHKIWQYKYGFVTRSISETADLGKLEYDHCIRCFKKIE